jgi:GNAT superfamily N-acetyltransferase
VVSKVKVIDYESRLAADFALLNYQWINEYFSVEEEDRKALDAPKDYAILSGGNIFFVMEDDDPVGTVAMVPVMASSSQTESVFELAKMAVRPDKRGKGYGSLLVNRCISFAREKNAKEIMLVTNDALKPALALYQRAGFKKVFEYSDSRYERGNLEMRLRLGG